MPPACRIMTSAEHEVILAVTSTGQAAVLTLDGRPVSPVLPEIFKSGFKSLLCPEYQVVVVAQWSGSTLCAVRWTDGAILWRISGVREPHWLTRAGPGRFALTRIGGRCTEHEILTGLETSAVPRVLHTAGGLQQRDVLLLRGVRRRGPWTIEWRDGVAGSTTAAFRFDDCPDAAAVYPDFALVTVSGSGSLFCLNRDGSERWRQVPEPATMRGLVFTDRLESPVLFSTTLRSADSRVVFALVSAKSGYQPSLQLWHFDASSGAILSRRIISRECSAFEPAARSSKLVAPHGILNVQDGVWTRREFLVPE